MSAFRRASGQTHSGYPASPGFKRAGTSEDSADGIAGKAMSLRARCYELIKAQPMSPEHAAEILHEPVHNLRPRFSELAQRNLIEDSGARDTAMGGRQCIIWRIKTHGQG